MATAPLHYNDATKQLKAWLSGVYTTVSGVITGSEVTKTTTGNIDDLDFSNATLIRMNNATDATIRGLAPGVGGQIVIIVSVGAGNVFLAHQNAGSTAADRLINFVTSGNTPLAAGVGMAAYEYDATTARWRLIAHDQGAFISFTGAFAFGGAAVGITYSSQFAGYYVRGRQVSIQGNLALTSKGSSTGVATFGTLPYTAAPTFYAPVGVSYYLNVTGVNGITGFVNVSDTNIYFYIPGATTVANMADTNFTATTQLVFSSTYVTT